MDKVLLYISAASDLDSEREILGRAVTEVPVTLGWRIVQSPTRHEPVDLDAVRSADLHFLLIGSDIRAPIGREWLAARRAGRRPALFLKQHVLRTPAAQSFIRWAGELEVWQPFRTGGELRTQALKLLAGYILERAGYYALSPVELARLQAWRSELETAAPRKNQDTRGGAGESGVVLSPERYVPSEGSLVTPP